MKKTFAILLAFIMMLFLVACGSANNSKPNAEIASGNENSTASSVAEESQKDGYSDDSFAFEGFQYSLVGAGQPNESTNLYFKVRNHTGCHIDGVHFDVQALDENGDVLYKNDVYGVTDLDDGQGGWTTEIPMYQIPLSTIATVKVKGFTILEAIEGKQHQYNKGVSYRYDTPFSFDIGEFEKK